MGEGSNIEWTGDTLNVFTALDADGRGGWHCEKVSPGCSNCYAEALNVARRWEHGTGLPYHKASRGEVKIRFEAARLEAQLRKTRPRMVFVNSMTDTFGEFVPDEFVFDLLDAIALRGGSHVWQLLTKRERRMRELVTAWLESRRLDELPAHVWLGVTVENAGVCSSRVGELIGTPAAVRWVSAEPLLGPIDLRRIQVGDRQFDALAGRWEGCHPEVGEPHINWVVAGGESGKGARICVASWIQALVGDCQRSGVGVFVKQLGENVHEGASLRMEPLQWPPGTRYEAREARITKRVKLTGKGKDMAEWPEALRVRGWPDNWGGFPSK